MKNRCKGKAGKGCGIYTGDHPQTNNLSHSLIYSYHSTVPNKVVYNLFEENIIEMSGKKSPCQVRRVNFVNNVFIKIGSV